MSPSRLFLACSLSLFAQIAVAQQTATTSPPPPSSTQGAAALQKALSALAPSAPIIDVTLTGTARRIAGSDDESGTAVIKALVGTGTRLDLTLPSGQRTEIRNTSSPEIAGSWSGPDGTAHVTAYHNLLTDPGWFPAITIASLLSTPGEVITYAGPETRGTQSVVHIKASQPLPASLAAPKDIAALMQHLTEVDIFLDASTLLPAFFAFSIHPDNNANLDIPVELRFSDYRPVNGAQIPFHVQKSLNNSLLLDLEFTDATLNSGLSPSTFAAGRAQ